MACEGVEMVEVGAGVDEEVSVFRAEETRKNRRDEGRREKREERSAAFRA